MENTEKGGPLSRRDWSKTEIEALKQAYQEGYSLHDIAGQIGRSYASVKSMAQRLGLKRPGETEGMGVAVEPLRPAEYSLSTEEAFRLMSGVLERLQKGPITRDEIKFLAVATKALDLYLKRSGDFVSIPGSKEEEQ